jgi:hypothetical protein
VQSEMALRPRELIRLLYSSEKKSMGIAETGPPRPTPHPRSGRASRDIRPDPAWRAGACHLASMVKSLLLRGVQAMLTLLLVPQEGFEPPTHALRMRHPRSRPLSLLVFFSRCLSAVRFGCRDVPSCRFK